MNEKEREAAAEAGGGLRGTKLVLASKSPRRAKILSGLGLEFEVVPTEAEEITIHDDPERTVTENSMRKLEACREIRPGSAIVAADTIVWYGGKIYGKPRDLDEARKFMKELSGQEHCVFTGVACCLPGGEPRSEVVKTLVRIKALSDEEIARYVEKVKPTDRAGAYDIDESGELIVESFTGSYENVMGLPVEPVIGGLLVQACAKEQTTAVPRRVS